MAAWCWHAVAPRGAPVSSRNLAVTPGGKIAAGADSGARLQRHSRIRRPAEFKQAFAKGFRITRAPLAVVCKPNDVGLPRVGLAIARKAAPRAVDRNRVKRLIREEFRQNQSRLPAVDLVFYGTAGLDAMDAARLRAVLAEIWLKVIDRCAGYSSDSSASTKSC
ncbi:MAG: ribonuclease P protein component [Nevskia sp.]|nr:ribonuclease P protein component [Nevskia sp.]